MTSISLTSSPPSAWRLLAHAGKDGDFRANMVKALEFKDRYAVVAETSEGDVALLDEVWKDGDLEMAKKVANELVVLHYKAVPMP